MPLTGRASQILNRRWEDADQPREGFVFEREDGSAIPYTTIDTQHDRTLPKLNAKGPNGEAPEHPVAHFRIYDLRHAFGTRLGEAGADSIMKLMGHGSITISCRYVHPTAERLESALARLDVYNEAQAKKQPATVTAIDTKIAYPPTAILVADFGGHGQPCGTITRNDARRGLMDQRRSGA